MFRTLETFLIKAAENLSNKIFWRWPDPGEKPAVKTTILEEDAVAKRAAEQWAREKEGKSESGTWTWWTDGSHTDDGRVGAAAIYLNREGWTVFRGYLGTG